jgi:CBS domain-containing protein
MIRTPVSVYASLDPATVREDSTLEEVADLLDIRGFSAMPVVDDEHRAIGVITRRDLLRVGALRPPEGRAVLRWELPDQRASDLMSRQILAVAPSTSLAEAAALMLDNHVHRVFIQVEHALEGVLTTRDVMRAISDLRLDAPISRFASRPVQTISDIEPLGTARRQLKELDIRGLVVAQKGAPIGIFDEEDALASRHRDANDSVEAVMGHEILVMGPKVPIHRAAARMSSMQARRVILVEDWSMVGILTGFDLAGAAAST